MQKFINEIKKKKSLKCKLISQKARKQALKSLIVFII